MLLEQKIKSFIKDYHNLIGVPFQQTINENIKATDRRKGVADNHYQKLHLKDHILLGSTTSKGLIKNINDKLEKFVNNQIESEKYAMKLVIPTEYYEEKDKKINKRFFKKIVPDKKNTFRFFFFGKDAESINKAEDFSTYRGTFRNLSSLGKYSNIINDDFDNPIKSKYDPTDLKRK